MEKEKELQREVERLKALLKEKQDEINGKKATIIIQTVTTTLSVIAVITSLCRLLLK